MCALWINPAACSLFLFQCRCPFRSLFRHHGRLWRSRPRNPWLRHWIQLCSQRCNPRSHPTRNPFVTQLVPTWGALQPVQLALGMELLTGSLADTMLAIWHSALLTCSALSVQHVTLIRSAVCLAQLQHLSPLIAKQALDTGLLVGRTRKRFGAATTRAQAA